MKASMSLSMEFQIRLTPEEMSDLEKKTLVGTIKAHNNLPGVSDEEIFNPRVLQLRKGSTGENLFVDLESFPKGADPSSHTHYLVTISQEGYVQLKETGATGDRIRNSIKVFIYYQRHYPY